MYVYDHGFYDYLNQGSVASAEVILPLLAGLLPVRSVADFGCGQGAWLIAWAKLGAEIVGIDGPSSGFPAACSLRSSI